MDQGVTKHKKETIKGRGSPKRLSCNSHFCPIWGQENPKGTYQHLTRLLAAVAVEGLSGYRSTSIVLMALKDPVRQNPMMNESTSGAASGAFFSRTQPQQRMAAMPKYSGMMKTWMRAFSRGKLRMSSPRLRSILRPACLATRL